MSDEVSQAQAEEQITPEQEVAEGNPEEGTPQQQQQPEKPVTLEDVRRMMREEVFPVIQSQVAKGENRVEKRIAERFTALDMNKKALNLSDEQVTQAKKAIMEEENMNAYAQPEPQQAGSEGQSQFNGGDEMIRFMDDQIGRVAEKVGVQVSQNDPEWKTFMDAYNDPQGSPAETILAYHQAATAKSERLKAQKKNAPARVTSTGTEVTTGTPLAKTSDDYWKKAHSKT